MSGFVPLIAFYVSIPLRSDFNQRYTLKSIGVCQVSIPLRSDFNLFIDVEDLDGGFVSIPLRSDFNKYLDLHDDVITSFQSL